MKIYLSERDFQHLEWAQVRRMFVSYYFYETLDLGRLLHKAFKNNMPEIFADSGAYQGMSLGKELKVNGYADWLHKWKHLFIAYSNLDVIGSVSETTDNQVYLESCGLNPIPVFHVSSPFRNLELLLNKYEYIALGGMVPYMKNIPKIMPWLIKCWKLQWEINKDAKFHGFGCTNWEVINNLHWYSVDSGTWAVSYKFGEIPLFESSKGKFTRCKLGEWNKWQKYASLLRSWGFDWRDFAGRRVHRKEICKLAAYSFYVAEDYLTKKWRNDA